MSSSLRVFCNRPPPVSLPRGTSVGEAGCRRRLAASGRGDLCRLGVRPLGEKPRRLAQRVGWVFSAGGGGWWVAGFGRCFLLGLRAISESTSGRKSALKSK